MTHRQFAQIETDHKIITNKKIFFSERSQVKNIETL